MALVVHVVDPDEFAGRGLVDCAGEKIHAGEGSDFFHAGAERVEVETFDFFGSDFSVAIGEAIPPAPPKRTESVEEAPVSGTAVEFAGNDFALEKIFFVGPGAHGEMEIFFVMSFEDDP